VSRSQAVTFAHKGFWAFDVAAGIFLKHLIDAAQDSAEIDMEWLSKEVSNWRVWAVIGDFGIQFNEHWSSEQRIAVIALVEKVCAELAKREFIPAEEIVSWPFVDDLRINPRGAKAALTAPVIELGHAIIELLRDEMPEPPKGEAWWLGSETGRTTVQMSDSWDGRWP
jgi:hypothetical protein